MKKIKFTADSGCDISHDEAKEFGIEILPILIIKDGKTYRDWYDFTPQELYASLKESKEFPTTSQVPVDVFLEAFQKAYDEDYDAVISPIISANGSGTYQSACIARDIFWEEKRTRDFRIDVIDSGVYSYMCGGPLIEGVKMARGGAEPEEIVSHLKGRFKKVCAYAVVYTLDCLIHSGRISNMAGLVGKLLDIKPVIKIADGSIGAVKNVWGKTRPTEKLAQMIKEEIDPDSDVIYMVCSDMDRELGEMLICLQRDFPGHKIIRANLGSVISVHTGPNLLGVGFYRK